MGALVEAVATVEQLTEKNKIQELFVSGKRLYRKRKRKCMFCVFPRGHG